MWLKNVIFCKIKTSPRSTRSFQMRLKKLYITSQKIIIQWNNDYRVFFWLSWVCLKIAQSNLCDQSELQHLTNVSVVLWRVESIAALWSPASKKTSPPTLVLAEVVAEVFFALPFAVPERKFNLILDLQSVHCSISIK